MFDTISSSFAHIKAGKLCALARMLVMQEDGKLRSYGLALTRDGLFEEVILHLLRQIAPAPNNGLA